MQEGLFLYTHDVSPYDGGVYHQAPLLLPVFSLLPEYHLKPFWTHLVFLLADIFTALALVTIADSNISRVSRLFTSTRKNSHWTGTAIAAAYLLNPFTVATCLAQSTSVITNCAILQAVAAAVSGNAFNTVFAISVASYLSMYPILLAPPLALLCFDQMTSASETSPSPVAFYTRYTTGLGVAISGLLYSSFLIMDSSWEFMSSTYGVQLTLSDLTPNVGLWWYFFIEMFDSFREFFLAVFWLHMSSYVVGLSIRVRYETQLRLCQADETDS